MSAQITTLLRSKILSQFVETYYNNTPDYRSLYLALCKDTPWPEDHSGKIETDYGFSPPPTDEDSVEDVWNDAIIFIRLHTKNIIPVIDECTFDRGDEWYYRGLNAPESTWLKSFNSSNTRKSIMRNSEGRVYRCVGEPSTGMCYIGGDITQHGSRIECEGFNGVWIPDSAIEEPTGLPDIQGAIITVGEYEWEYLWTLDHNTIIDSVNYRWQPVAYNLYQDGGVCKIDGQVDGNYQTKEDCLAQPLSNWVYNSTPYFEQHFYGVASEDVIEYVGVTDVMMHVLLDKYALMEHITSFRQMFLVDTPYDATNEKAIDDVMLASEMSTELTGDVYFLENRIPVHCTEDQRESVKIIMKF